MGMTLGFIH